MYSAQRSRCLRVRSQRNISVLLWRIFIALTIEYLECGDQQPPRVARQDYGIDIATLSGNVGVSELLAKLVHFL